MSCREFTGYGYSFIYALENAIEVAINELEDKNYLHKFNWKVTNICGSTEKVEVHEDDEIALKREFLVTIETEDNK